MRILKYTLLTIFLVAAIIAAGVALFWERLLTVEQKLSYGLTFSAAGDIGEQARAHPRDRQILHKYVDVLVSEGNLGRAAYLSELYGIENARLPGLREAVKHSLEAAAEQEVYALHDDPVAAQARDEPLGQALLYLEGYRHALLGDWASAKNFFEAIDRRKLAPVLRPYRLYYLARSYRLAGSGDDKAKVAPLLLDVLEESPNLGLKSKARYNLIAWYLSDAYPGSDGLPLAKGQELSLSLQPRGWAMQKAYIEFGEYYWANSSPKEAWKKAQEALLMDTENAAGKTAGLLCLEILEGIAPEDKDDQTQEDDAFDSLDLNPGVFTALARWGAMHGFSGRVAVLLDSLKPHVKDRALWEELRVGLSICYRAAADSAAMRVLMTDANLRDLSDESLAEIYFEHATLLEDERRFNDAISYYRSSGRLGGPRSGEAFYRCYAILVKVQDPLKIDAAIDYLVEVVEHHPKSLNYRRSVEELFPLLIYRGDETAAALLAESVLTREVVPCAAGGRRTEEQLQEVAHYWLAYLAGRAGDREAAQAQRAKIPCRYWNYYELASNYPPKPGLHDAPLVLSHGEDAGEYFAGLGLTAAAREFYKEQDDPGNQVLLYFTLANAALTARLPTRQWQATEVLESGLVKERVLLDYVLGEAYP
ncbi:hypothetical protein IIA79_07745, partial [bacterium]|nr:hypothetical protein [bacterium]